MNEVARLSANEENRTEEITADKEQSDFYYILSSGDGSEFNVEEWNSIWGILRMIPAEWMRDFVYMCVYACVNLVSTSYLTC